MVSRSATRSRPARALVTVLVAAGAIAGVAALAAVGAGSGWFGGNDRAEAPEAGETATAARGRFIVTITESGEVEAKRSTDVKCEVEGQSTVIWLIEEGSVVEAGDKLMELDAADLEESHTARRMAYDSAKAALERARQAFEIQKSTNESSLSDAALTIKFALLDLRKYLGAALADTLVAAEGQADFDTLVRDPALGGEALQQKRTLASDIDLAAEELQRAESQADWTRKLEAKGYVTGSELEADELAVKRKRVEKEQAETALELFLAYEFPKQAEQLFTDWREAKREFARVEARAASELASAKADLDGKQAAFDLEAGRLQKVEQQLANVILRAPQPGMVVYAREGRRWGQDDELQLGSSVRHQQTLFQIPDLSEMQVNAKLHESVVKQVDPGARAFVVVDARPDERLTGTVTKIAVMPDRTHWWLNPGVKTYTTEVTLDQTPEGMKPGMSAQVEILVADRPDVLQVPVSAVHVDKGYQVVYEKTLAGPAVRPVETGLSNDRTIEVLSGLKPGAVVYLYKPDGAPELDVDPDAEAEAARAALGEVRTEAAETPAREEPERKRPEMTPGQLKALRERLEKATPEERERMLKRLKERGLAPGGQPSQGGGGGDGGRP